MTDTKYALELSELEDTTSTLQISKKEEPKEKKDGTILYCFKCNEKLPDMMKLREDGVSTYCPCCSQCNIIQPLYPGNKWMYIFWCDKIHYQQLPEETEEDQFWICDICEYEGRIYDAEDKMAKFC